MHSKYNIVITPSTANRKFINTISEYKKHKIKIINSLNAICFDEKNKQQYKMIKDKDYKLYKKQNLDSCDL